MMRPLRPPCSGPEGRPHLRRESRVACPPRDRPGRPPRPAQQRTFISGSAPGGGGRRPGRPYSQDSAYHSLPVRILHCILAPLPRPLVVIL